MYFVFKVSEFFVGIILRRDVYDFREVRIFLYFFKVIILLGFYRMIY